MAKITIDDKEYDFDSLSDNAKANVVNLQFVQQEIKKLRGQIAVFQTAESAYQNNLKEALK